MKLRNKKTGEIIDIYKGEITLHYNHGRKTIHFKRLEDLEEWEDYEEPKEHWCINEFGTPEMAGRFNRENIYDKSRKLIGNDFGTKEEAKLAVQKLKAWKRLKDKGFDRVFSVELGDALCGGKTVAFKLLIDDKDSIEDVKLLFGSKDE